MLNFSKMHGLGNDFMVLDGITQKINLQQLPIPQLSDRHLGIGFDQLLIVETATQADFFCRIFNADGSEAEQCGNGLRCVAKFIADQELSLKKSLLLQTKAGLFQASLHSDDKIEITMGMPCFTTEKIPPHLAKLSILSLGNPHAIMQVAAVLTYPVAEMGLQISTDAYFPHGVNVGFMEVINRQHIRLRTFERGAGITLACGSNACAAVAAGIQQGILDNTVKVELALGNLAITWQHPQQAIVQQGPATLVFKGVLT